ncbi:MAG TPA: type IV toxin-antitoxin system AbiEi family antitoxin domain-containing protein [Arthrobacter sp.]|nr:type IV toxin-antitoxin system AbiEi family antitoxin domain-containing protein [Arthrobacter sp.]
MNIVDFLQRHSGVVRTSQLKQAGFSRQAIAQAASLGLTIKLSRGVYGLPGSNQLGEALTNGGLLTCVSAAPFYKLWILHEARSLHLSRSHPMPAPKIVEHGRTRHPQHGWLPLAGLADVLVHSLRCLPELDALVMVQSAVGRGDIELDFLYGKVPGRRNGKARSVLDLVIPRADSVLEVLANTHFVRAGLRVRRHVIIPGVGEVDFLIEECLVVETDGSTHFAPQSVKKDQRRNNRSILGGYLVLRYYYADVVFGPDEMVAEVLAVLKLRREGRFH